MQAQILFKIDMQILWDVVNPKHNQRNLGRQNFIYFSQLHRVCANHTAYNFISLKFGTFYEFRICFPSKDIVTQITLKNLNLITFYGNKILNFLRNFQDKAFNSGIF